MFMLFCEDDGIVKLEGVFNDEDDAWNTSISLTVVDGKTRWVE